jgi:hypothetical protein
LNKHSVIYHFLNFYFYNISYLSKKYFLKIFKSHDIAAGAIIKRMLLFIIAIAFAQIVFSQSNTNEQICPGGEVNIAASDSGTIYQWQQNSGEGFTDITGGSNYSGFDIRGMQLVNLPTSWYGYQYRCVIDGIAGKDTFTLRFVNQWVGITEKWSEARNWSCGKVPDSSTDVIINAVDDVVIVDANAICRSLALNPNASVSVDPGVNLTIVH